jgi:hypothetical protein
MAFQFLAYLLCHLLLRVYAAITEVSVLEGLLGQIVAGNCHAPGSLSPCLWMFVCPDTDNNLLSNGVIAYIMHGFIHLSYMRR